jgi:hypothetical protein
MKNKQRTQEKSFERSAYRSMQDEDQSIFSFDTEADGSAPTPFQ